MTPINETDRKLIAMRGLRDELAKTESLVKRLCGIAPEKTPLADIFKGTPFEGMGGL